MSLAEKPQAFSPRTSGRDCTSYPTRQTELRADCFAGVWGYSQYENVEPGDVSEAMTISWVSGDLPGTPSNAMGAHGKPDERVKWFRTGYDSGSADECLTLTPIS